MTHQGLVGCVSRTAHRVVWLSFVLVSCLFSPPPTAHSTQHSKGLVGVLILAHGGSEQWNRTVAATVEQAQLAYPTEVAFGMGMHRQEVDRWQQAVDRLHAQGVGRIVVVPLLVSSASEVSRQVHYLFGLRDDGPWEAHVQPLALPVPVFMARALDDDPVVADILLERALGLSRVPAEESVILIAHGPNADDDNAQWLEVMTRLGRWIQAQGRFRAVVPVTMRDDASAAVQGAATRQLREVVHHQSAQGRTIVVPLLIASGGIEAKIPQRLEGLQYVYDGATLLPHPKVAQWIARQVEAALEADVPVARVGQL